LAAADVRHVVVTHGHADHCGLAGEFARRQPVTIHIHQRDAYNAVARYGEQRRMSRDIRRWMGSLGAPDTAVSAALSRVDSDHRHVVELDHVSLLHDGDSVDVGPWSLRVIHTPGHTAGHVCLYEPTHRLLFSGDHVLPRVNVGPTARPLAVRDPIAAYLRSLRRLMALDVTWGLPGHSEPFKGVPSRLRALEHYHRRRLIEVRGLVSAGFETAWDIAGSVRRSRPWSELSDVARGTAAAEALAHLRHLRARGMIGSSGRSPIRWSADAA
jgi:glyoxylase-like metal-dependent hydrolase (beta-lactamase superfamily II)